MTHHYYTRIVAPCPIVTRHCIATTETSARQTLTVAGHGPGVDIFSTVSGFPGPQVLPVCRAHTATRMSAYAVYAMRPLIAVVDRRLWWVAAEIAGSAPRIATSLSQHNASGVSILGGWVVLPRVAHQHPSRERDLVWTHFEPSSLQCNNGEQRVVRGAWCVVRGARRADVGVMGTV